MRHIRKKAQTSMGILLVIVIILTATTLLLPSSEITGFAVLNGTNETVVNETELINETIPVNETINAASEIRFNAAVRDSKNNEVDVSIEFVDSLAKKTRWAQSKGVGINKNKSLKKGKYCLLKSIQSKR